ncbi:MAG: helix-turn-helix domain-containing protein [Desulfovibrionaceae bacterium]
MTLSERLRVDPRAAERLAGLVLGRWRSGADSIGLGTLTHEYDTNCPAELQVSGPGFMGRWLRELGLRLERRDLCGRTLTFLRLDDETGRWLVAAGALRPEELPGAAGVEARAAESAVVPGEEGGAADDPEHWVDRYVAAQVLGLSANGVFYLCRRGHLESRGRGRRMLIRMESVERYRVARLESGRRRSRATRAAEVCNAQGRLLPELWAVLLRAASRYWRDRKERVPLTELAAEPGLGRMTAGRLCGLLHDEGLTLERLARRGRPQDVLVLDERAGQWMVSVAAEIGVPLHLAGMEPPVIPAAILGTIRAAAGGGGGGGRCGWCSCVGGDKPMVVAKRYSDARWAEFMESIRRTAPGGGK